MFKQKKKFIFMIVGIAVLIGAGCGGYSYWKSLHYFATDNAKVTSELYKLYPPVSGKLVRLDFSVGSYVDANEVIARIENGPYIRSPIDGQIVDCDVIVNEVLPTTAVVAVIADTNNIYINANIEETDILKIKEGQEVEVTLDALDGKKLIGHVKQVGHVTQSALSGNVTSYTTSGTYSKVTQLLPVKIQLDENNTSLDKIIGTNAYVRIRIK